MAYVNEAPGGPNSSRAAAPAGQYRCTRRARVAASARQPWMWGELERHARQPIRATSRNRLSSDTLEEMEARLMSRAAIMLIARATVLPRVCAGEARRNTSSVACARAVVLYM